MILLLCSFLFHYYLFINIVLFNKKRSLRTVLFAQHCSSVITCKFLDCHQYFCLEMCLHSSSLPYDTGHEIIRIVMRLCQQQNSLSKSEARTFPIIYGGDNVNWIFLLFWNYSRRHGINFKLLQVQGNKWRLHKLLNQKWIADSW